MSEVTVFIIDDDVAVRDSTRLLLKAAGIKAEVYADAAQFLGSYDPARPGVVLVDVRMPGMSGLDLQEVLNSRHAGLPLIVMTGHGDIPMAVHAMQHGAVDFIEKPYADQQLLSSVRKCLEQVMLAQRTDAAQQLAARRLATLTRRERQIMELLCAGKPNKVIAAELDISARTVEVHRARIMEKLQVKSVADIVRLALTPS